MMGVIMNLKQIERRAQKSGFDHELGTVVHEDIPSLIAKLREARVLVDYLINGDTNPTENNILIAMQILTRAENFLSTVTDEEVFTK
jgi:hypothetical protein